MLQMSQKFDELKQKLKNVDKAKTGQLVKEIKQARDDGEIDENEKKELLNSAKTMVGDLDISGFLNK
jgi:transcription elongation GreA/GreB family factor